MWQIAPRPPKRNTLKRQLQLGRSRRDGKRKKKRREEKGVRASAEAHVHLCHCLQLGGLVRAGERR